MTLELQAIRAELRRLGAQRDSDNATVVTTASALKDAEAARRARSEQSWTPFARAAVIASALVALASMALAVWAATR